MTDKRKQTATHGVHSYAHFTRKWGAHPYFKVRPRNSSGTSWTVPNLCKAYGWPQGLAGGGVIAIVELGGGWVQSDMQTFFSGIGQPVPQITDVSVDGTQNKPDPDPNGPDGEVALDIQVAGAAYYAATGKPATIRIYWAQDIAPAVQKAAADGCDVCSISWGSDEAEWGADGGRSDGTDRHERDGRRHGRVRGVGRQRFQRRRSQCRECRSAGVMPACDRLRRHQENGDE